VGNAGAGLRLDSVVAHTPSVPAGAVRPPWAASAFVQLLGRDHPSGVIFEELAVTAAWSPGGPRLRGFASF